MSSYFLKFTKIEVKTRFLGILRILFLYWQKNDEEYVCPTRLFSLVKIVNKYMIKKKHFALLEEEC